MADSHVGYMQQMGCCSESATHHLHDAPAVECPALRVIQAMSLSPELDLHNTEPSAEGVDDAVSR
jgi:hypothetical protein